MASEAKQTEAKKVTGKVVVLSGATGGIGKEIALGCLKQPGELVLLLRDAEKGKALVAELEKAKTASANVTISVERVDLDSKQSIAAFVERFKQKYDRLDVLLNNAATVPDTRGTSKDGIETQLAVNVLSYLWLMTGLHGHLKKANGARVVNVASNYAGDLDFTDLQFTKRKYDPNSAYRQSKALDRMISVAAAELWKDDKILVNACHPGVVTTTLLKGLGFGKGWNSASEAAATPLHCAFDKSVDTSGKWWDNKSSSDEQFGDPKKCKSLWDTLLKY